MATDPIESTLDRVVATLRAELGSAFARQAAEITERTTAEREAAIRQASDAVRKETQEQLDQARRTAHEQIESAKRTAQEQVESAKRTAQEQIDAARRSAQAESAARVRAEAQVEDVRRIGRTQVEEVQRTLGDRLSAVSRELDESRRETAVRRQELDSARGESAASLTDLVRGLHAVDEAESLTAVFDRLLESAQKHADRVALLMVRQDGLREWAQARGDGQSGVGDRGMSVASNAASEGRRVESESGIAFPLAVGGEVVAVLYAEAGDALSAQRRIAKDALDALTRHAGRMLETLTVQQAAGLRPVRREASARADRSMGERSGERLP